jgi:predicted ArsR family transcriptional regulator
MSSKRETKQSTATPDDYRQFAADCIAMPSHRRGSRAVQLMLAKAWDKLADQTEEWRKQHPPSAAA